MHQTNPLTKNKILLLLLSFIVIVLLIPSWEQLFAAIFNLSNPFFQQWMPTIIYENWAILVFSFFLIVLMVNILYIHIFPTKRGFFRRMGWNYVPVYQFPNDNPEPIFRVDHKYTILYANKAAQKIIETWTLDSDSYLPPIYQQSIQKALETGTRQDFEIDVGKQYYSFVVFPVEAKRITHLYGKNITQHKKIQEELQLAASIFENTIEGIMITDTHGKIQEINKGFTRITGYYQEEVQGQFPSILKSNRHSQSFYEELWKSLEKTGYWEGEVWNRRKNGEAYPQWLVITALKNKAGETTHYIGVFSDITQVKLNEEQLKYEANHDPLTNLHNRTFFYERLSIEISHAKRKRNQIAVLFADLDRFKSINDYYGHLIGDVVIQEVADRLLTIIPENGALARISGDEFALLLLNPETLQEVINFAEQVLKKIKEPISYQNHTIVVTTSVGISFFPSDGMEPKTLTKHADMALHRSKEQDGDNYQFFVSELTRKAEEKLRLEHSLRRSLENGEFYILYHPFIDLTTGSIVGVEALLRWKHPELGLVPTEAFIPLAEETGLIVSISNWVLRSTCKQIRAWMDQDLPSIYVSVNLSSKQFKHERLLDLIDSTLEETQIDSSFLQLEITEHSIMQNIQNSISLLNEIKERGIKISMDDFGTGYSSLSYLKHFAIDTLKIDRSFVIDLGSNKKDTAILSSIINLAHTLNMNVIAEGVDSYKQLDILREKNCDIIQGYLFSKPVDAETIESFLAENKKLPLTQDSY